MKKTILIISAIVVLSLAAIGVYILRPSEEASAPIQATPIATQTQAAPAIATEPQADPTEPSNPQAGEPGLSGTTTYQISQGESEVRFSLDEILRGKPFRPVGVTNQVAGEISLDFDQKQALAGTIQVNARTLETDSEFRNRAIHNEILETDEFEFITFVPSEITGLPQEAVIGEPVQFQITGDLTIRDVTQQVTFEITATLVDESRLEGYGKTTVLRSDYGLTIPSVPSVADVSDEVLLEIDFVALAS
jgi:polyisoprenoid-binding protein YceI